MSFLKNLLFPKNSAAIKTPETSIEYFQDFVAPSAIDITTNYIQINNRFARAIFISDYPRSISDGWLAPLINLNETIDISIFIHPTNTGDILKNLTKNLTRIKAEILDKSEKGIISSPLLEASEREMEEMRTSLQEGRERFFRLGIYFTLYAESLEKLKELEEYIESVFNNILIKTRAAILQQEKGINSTFPLGMDELYITQPMNSSPLSSVFPFISADLTDNKGILYGINKTNNSLIIFDRFSLENANTVVIGKSGGGKSYATKLEILRSLMFDTEIFIIDPENEYQYLAETVDGAYFKIALNSPHHINPFDLRKPLENETDSDIIRENIIEIVAILKIMLGGFTPEEDSIIDKALNNTYESRDITSESGIKDKTPPTLTDLQSVLDGMNGGESLARRLEKFTKGRFSGFFNQQTNLAMERKLIVFNIRDMEEELRPIAMYIIINYIWKKIRLTMKKRLLFIDEAWWMLQHEESANFLLSIAKRCRKYYLGLTTITQDVTDFTKSKYGEPILTNSSLQMLFKQSPTTIDQTQKIFGLTDAEKNILLETNIGEGLFFAGTKHVLMQVEASYSENQIITSDPEEILKIQKTKNEM